MPGTVSHAGWTVSWSIPTGWGGGLVISKAQFQDPATQQKRMVLYKGTTPFVLVPYHGGSPIFKDGINHQGAPFTPVLPTSKNATVGSGTPPAANDNQWDPGTNPAGAVVIEKEAATLIAPESLVIWAKFQCGNYQYVHHWEFNADGSFEPGVGLGGRLWQNPPDRMNHIHTFYFRLDFDVDGSGNNAVQEFAHPNNNPGSDGWTTIAQEGRRLANPGTARKWRVVNKTPKPNGQLRSYELIPGSDGLPDGMFSTGDLWVVRWKPGAEDGSNVGCNDNVLGTQYANGENVDGEDVVVWHCLRTHHLPRHRAEEDKVLPYEWVGFRIEPRDFTDHTPAGLYPTTPSSP